MRDKLKYLVLATSCLLVAACGGMASSGADTAGDILSKIDKQSNKTKPFVPPWPSPDYKNYDFANRLFASPNTILWCTTTWGNPSSPLVTVPVAGKLTSSSVSFFPSSRVRVYSDSGEYTPERRSVDGMYHGTPPPYRYGRTPGGQYIDFFNMPTLCTTQPLKFQREKTSIALSVDGALNTATNTAEAALKRGDRAGAQQALEDAIGKGG
jgi:hypothetical protein